MFVRQYDMYNASNNPINNIVAGISFVALGSLFISPPQTLGIMTRRMGLMALVLIQLKNQWDSEFTKLSTNLPRRNHVVLITGGNGVLGREVGYNLLLRDVRVILACRSLNSCFEAAEDLKKRVGDERRTLVAVASLPLNLSDLESVHTFAKTLRSSESRLDYIVHLAGEVTLSGARTQQEFEYSIGSLFLGPFALTHWLLPLLLRPVTHLTAAKVIYAIPHVALAISKTKVGVFDSSLMLSDSGEGDWQGELTDNCGTSGWYEPLTLSLCALGQGVNSTSKRSGYSRAHLASMLGAQELQRRLDHIIKEGSLDSSNTRRVIVGTADPGTIASNLSLLHSVPVLSSYTLRSAAAGAVLITEALLSDELLPGGHFDSALNPADPADFRNDPNGLATHVQAHPSLSSQQLPFMRKSSIKKYSAVEDTFRSLTWLHCGSDQQCVAEVAHTDIASRLYDVSAQLLKDFESGKQFFQTNIVFFGVEKVVYGIDALVNPENSQIVN